MSFWEKMAKVLDEKYEVYPNFKQRYFFCPKCNNRIYENDWDEIDLISYCPICHFDW